MKEIKDHVEAIKKLKDGDCYFISLGEEAGADVRREGNLYFFFEIPQYGGEPRLFSTADAQNIETLVMAVMRWT